MPPVQGLVWGRTHHPTHNNETQFFEFCFVEDWQMVFFPTTLAPLWDTGRKPMGSTFPGRRGPAENEELSRERGPRKRVNP